MLVFIGLIFNCISRLWNRFGININWNEDIWWIFDIQISLWTEIITKKTVKHRYKKWLYNNTMSDNLWTTKNICKLYEKLVIVFKFKSTKVVDTDPENWNWTWNWNSSRIITALINFFNNWTWGKKSRSSKTLLQYTPSIHPRSLLIINRRNM